jgi:hypothetical protein
MPAGGELREDRAARRVGKGGERGVEGLGSHPYTVRLINLGVK